MSTFEKESSSGNTDTLRTAQCAKLHEEGEQPAHIPTHAEIVSSEPWKMIRAWPYALPKLTSEEEELVLRQEVHQTRNLPSLPPLDQLPAGWRSKAHHRHLHLIRNEQFEEDQRRSMSDRQRR